MLILNKILFQSYCYTENNDFSFIYLDFLAFPWELFMQCQQIYRVCLLGGRQTENIVLL